MNQAMCFQYGERDCRKAIKLFRKAQRVAERNQLRPHLVTLLVNKAQVLFDLEQYQRALQSVQEGLSVAKQFGYRQPYVSMQSNQALYQCVLGLWEKAHEAGESALNLASHFVMIYSCGFNRHTLGMLAGQAGDPERCIAFQLASIRDLVEVNRQDSAGAALSEILMVENQWHIHTIVRSDLEEHSALMEGLDDQGGNVHALSLRAQLSLYRVFDGKTPKHLAEKELRDCLESAVSQGTRGPQAEIGEALVTFLAMQERLDEACEVGQELLPALGRHYYPLNVPPFLLTLASAQERAGRWEALKPVIRALRRYEKTLDRGLTGIRYHALLSRVAERAGRKKAGRESRERAVQIARAVLALQKSPPYRDAFLALPEVRDLLGSVE
jgi:tetratricopeptide (TPR) repeat protein